MHHQSKIKTEKLKITPPGPYEPEKINSKPSIRNSSSANFRSDYALPVNRKSDTGICESKKITQPIRNCYTSGGIETAASHIRSISDHRKDFVLSDRPVLL